MTEAAFIVPRTRLLCHYYDGDSAARVLMRKIMNRTPRNQHERLIYVVGGSPLSYVVLRAVQANGLHSP